MVFLCSVLLSSTSSAQVAVVDSQADADDESAAALAPLRYPPGDELPLGVDAVKQPVPNAGISLVNQIPLLLPAAPTIDVSDLSAADAMLYRMDVLEQELRGLRGMVEEQQHTIMQLRQQQQARYLDLDRRIGTLSDGFSQAPDPATNVAGPTVVSTATSVSVPAQPEATEVAIATSPVPVPVNPEIDAKAHYRAAFQKIRDKEYDIAIAQLNEHVNLFPQGAYTANAYYWLGEVYVVLPTPQLEQAQQAFTQVINRYPGHRKVPDALFKLGRVLSRLGDRVQAKEIWQALLAKYPQSSAAKLAATELESL